MSTIQSIISHIEKAGFKVYPLGSEPPKTIQEIHVCNHDESNYRKSWLYKNPICLICEPYFNNTCGSCSSPRWRCAC